jgi:hypothetical protein
MIDSISAFAVFLRMQDDDNHGLKLAPLGNVLHLQKVKAGTKVTIGVEGDAVSAIALGKYVGGLILCDKEQFEATKERMLREHEAGQGKPLISH